MILWEPIWHALGRWALMMGQVVMSCFLSSHHWHGLHPAWAVISNGRSSVAVSAHRLHHDSVSMSSCGSGLPWIWYASACTSPQRHLVGSAFPCTGLALSKCSARTPAMMDTISSLGGPAPTAKMQAMDHSRPALNSAPSPPRPPVGVECLESLDDVRDCGCREVAADRDGQDFEPLCGVGQCALEARWWRSTPSLGEC